jgi:hypothetical protein
MMLQWLGDTLERVVDVVPEAGWSARSYRQLPYTPVGVMVHHTAPPNPFPVRVLIDGRPDLPGPLCQLFIDQGGRCHLIAAGYANGAGPGSSIVLTEVRADWPPSGDAKTRGLSDDTAGNRWFINIEVDHPGNGDPLNPLQQIALPRVCATLLVHQGWTANRIIGHREWTKRKTDPNFGLTMGQLRRTVGDLIRGHEEFEMTTEQIVKHITADQIRQMKTLGLFDEAIDGYWERKLTNPADPEWEGFLVNIDINSKILAARPQTASTGGIVTLAGSVTGTLKTT